MQLEAAAAGAGAAGRCSPRSPASATSCSAAARSAAHPSIARRVGPAAARRPVRGGRAAWILRRCLPRAWPIRAVRAVERARRQLARRPRRGRRLPTACCAACRRVPDRVCRRRAPLRPCGVVGGTGVALAPESVVREDELFVAVDVEGGGRRPDAVVRVASAVRRREWLPTLFRVRSRPRRRWSRRCTRRSSSRRECYADLVLAETIRTDVTVHAPASAGRRGDRRRDAAGTTRRNEAPSCPPALPRLDDARMRCAARSTSSSPTPCACAAGGAAWRAASRRPPRHSAACYPPAARSVEA